MFDRAIATVPITRATTELVHKLQMFTIREIDCPQHDRIIKMKLQLLPQLFYHVDC